MSYDCAALADMHPSGDVLDEPVVDRTHTSAQRALPDLQPLMPNHNGSVAIRPLDSAAPQSAYTTPVASSVRASRTIRPTLSNLLNPDATIDMHPSERTLGNPNDIQMHPPVQNASHKPLLVPSQAPLVASRPSGHGPILQAGSLPVPQVSPSGPTRPACPTRFKQKHNGELDTPNERPGPKRAKTTANPNLANLVPNSISMGPSSSANKHSIATLSPVAIRPVPSTLATNSLAPKKTASFPIPDHLDLPAVPDPKWCESLFGKGALYFTLSPDNKWGKQRLPKTAVEGYACRYACPVVGVVCWRTYSTQDGEWLGAIAGNKVKSFFPRHEAEWLRHLAFHRWNEWARACGMPLLEKTTWDHARIDAQIVKDIEQPDKQPWCPSEIQTRKPKTELIKWLQASTLPNGYN